MSVETVALQSVLPWQGHYNGPFEQRTLKRKLLHPAVRQVSYYNYPSPPMSSPPSPSIGPPSELPTTAASALPSLSSSLEGPFTTLAPALEPSLPTTQPSLSSAGSGQAFSQTPFTAAGRPASIAPARQTLGASIGSTIAPSAPSISGEAGPSASRGGRRSKTHVASACINCKRAHLSCDVQRPCARCVASGKQDSCVDVQHKKRGRPRLREEGEFRAEQGRAEPTSAPNVTAGPSQPPARPIAGVRHRRGESFRSLRSQTSEDSPTYSVPTPGYGPSTTLPSPFSSHRRPPPASVDLGFEVPTALLNMDFVIVKANRPFEHIMLRGQDVRGRQIADIAAPADNESFQVIRNRLREEREAHEPAYMPPILQQGEEPVLGVTEVEAEQYTFGFQERTYSWTHTQLGTAAEVFPARVRLAKASTYFVLVTLPSFRPVRGQPQRTEAVTYTGPLIPGPPLRYAEPLELPRQLASQSAPPGSFFPFPTPAVSSQSLAQQLASSSYPPPQSHQPYQQAFPSYQPAPDTPRLPVAEPPAAGTPFTSRAVMREILQSSPAGELQLPPIMESPSAAGPSGSQRTGAAASSEEEEGGDGSPRKRRRMGIHDVLQK